MTPTYQLVLVFVSFISVGCFNNAARPPVAEQSLELPAAKSSTKRAATRKPSSARLPKSVYLVRKGDTLYSIAWAFEMDAAGLGRANGIKTPYTIYPGQKIRLITAKAPEIERKRPVTKITKPLKWRSPTNATISRKYGKNNKGIDYTLEPPTKIRAAAAGEVVYSGVGIRGFRHLVIINHADNYLSAYGLNEVARVKEGESVKAGGLVADIRTKSPRLAKMHFEIRKEGVPVNPLTVIQGK